MAGTEPRIGKGKGLSDDLIDRLRLVRSPGHRPDHLSPADRSASAAPARRSPRFPTSPGAAAAGRRASLSRDDAEREIARVEKLGARYLLLGQGLYPRLLAEIEDAPPLLIAKGELGLLDRPAVAMVGARNASAAACRFARGLAHDLGQRGAGGRLRPRPRHRQRRA